MQLLLNIFFFQKKVYFNEWNLRGRLVDGC